MLMHQKQLKTLQDTLQNHLDNILPYISVLLILFSGYIVELCNNIDQKWELMLGLYRLSFLLIVITLKNNINIYLHKIIISLLLNDFIDRYYNIDYWSWNDTITILYIISILLFHKFLRK